MANAISGFRMLDEFGTELENTDSKLDTTMKKVAKVLHMSNGNRFVYFCSRLVIVLCFRSPSVDSDNSPVCYPADCDTSIYLTLITFLASLFP